jgi:hypothetical protein
MSFSRKLPCRQPFLSDEGVCVEGLAENGAAYPRTSGAFSFSPRVADVPTQHR